MISNDFIKAGFPQDVSGLFDKYLSVIENHEPIKTTGQIKKINGALIQSWGPISQLGEICHIALPNGKIAKAEVVGFNGQFLQMLALDNLEGIASGCRVYSHGTPLEVPVGNELMGRILNGLGDPIDEKEAFFNKKIPIHRKAPNVLKRKRIERFIKTGVKAIDGLLTVGCGQRVGIFSASGVGKSTVLSMIARNTDADLNVICLVGERGREVREFIERDLGEDGLTQSILVVSTSDAPPLTRIRSLYTATTIAEYFRDQGMNVMLMVDSITRFAMAGREIGSLLEEPPTVKGYSPSVFSTLANILERTGHSDRGSITAFYTVLMEGDDIDDPIVDYVRGILDGHVVLSRDLALKNHYPAIDLVGSISRLMPYIVDEEHYQASKKIKEWLAHYRSVEDLLNVGAYVRGENSLADEAIDKIDKINDLVKQEIFEEVSNGAIRKEVIEIAFGAKSTLSGKDNFSSNLQNN